MRTLAAGLAALALAAAAPPPPKGATYVALGSSFAAGPGVTHRAPGSPVLCARSDNNYAHLLARRRGFRLVDMTCTGATTAEILTKAQAGQPPQITGVTPDARLVTVTIGGNDIGYLGDMWASSCALRPAATPPAWRPLICKPMTPAAVADAEAALPGNMHRVFAAIRARAPEAEIVLVDYATVLPPSGGCPARAPLAAAELEAARAQAAALQRITDAAVRRDGIKRVSASALTVGHDVCAADPWVSGFTLPPTPRDFGVIPYHPTARSMQVVAEALDKAL